jgi:UDPglucose 6-dehydrogenase
MSAVTPASSATRRPRRLTVIGAGYVGLATAIGLATRGHLIDLIEVRPDRLEALRAGVLPIHEPGMDAAFADPSIRDRIRPSDHIVDKRPGIILVCVGTPVKDGSRSDLSQVRIALEGARPFLAAGVPLVVRSTLPPGSTAQLVRWADGERSRIFTNPEFLQQGTALEDFLAPTRVVIGTFPGPELVALEMVSDVLKVPGVPMLTVSVSEAELIKNTANAFLALKLSFTDEIAGLCEALGADVMHVLEGIGLDPRIGRRYMRPGYGFGGSCLPKELRALTNVGRDLGVEMHVTSAASEANEAHQRRFARRVAAALPPRCRRVALLGLAFKAGTDDVRHAPALRVAQLLLDRDLEVVGYDPFAAGNAAIALPALELASSAEAALAGAGVAAITTEWPEFRDLDWASIGETMAARIIVDGRRLLDPSMMQSLGFRYEAIGAPAVLAEQPRQE